MRSDAVGCLDGDGHDFRFESPRAGRKGGATMALQSEAVERFAIEAIIARYHLGAHELAERFDP